MDVSPFPHQGPLDPDDVHGRAELLADLTERVTEHRVTALLGPRQFGKTSVLARLAHDLTEVATVRVDLFGATAWADLLAMFSGAVRDSVPAVREPTMELAISAGLDLGVARASLTATRRDRSAETDKAEFRALLEALVGAASHTPVLLLLDEFQDVVNIRGATAMFRTALQHHYRTMGIVFAGSAPSAMRTIFTRPDEPFYNQADIVTVEPLVPSAVHRIVNVGFHATGRDPGTVASLIHAHTSGHPQRTMLTADVVWRLTDDQPAHLVWSEARAQLRHAQAHVLAAVFGRASTSEQKVLRLVAHGLPLYGNDAERIGLTSGTAAHTKRALLADGTLREGEATVVTDPLLSDWIKIRLPL